MGGQARRCNSATAARGRIRDGDGSHGETHGLAIAERQQCESSDQALRDQNGRGEVFQWAAGSGEAMSTSILGVDIGGTKVAVGIVDSEGKILTQGRKPMVANGTAQAGLD